MIISHMEKNNPVDFSEWNFSFEQDLVLPFRVFEVLAF